MVLLQWLVAYPAKNEQGVHVSPEGNYDNTLSVLWMLLELSYKKRGRG